MTRKLLYVLFLSPKIIQCYIAIAICIISPPSASMSRMGTATITDLKGMPCFSIPLNFETKKGMPLHGIFISELPDGISSKLPPYVWSIRAINYDLLPILYPKKCVQYAETPEGTAQHILEPLKLFKVYSVFIHAKHDGSSMIGYSGEFCLKPAGSGRTIVQTIPEDYSLGDARFAGCVR